MLGFVRACSPRTQRGENAVDLPLLKMPKPAALRRTELPRVDEQHSFGSIASVPLQDYQGQR